MKNIGIILLVMFSTHVVQGQELTFTVDTVYSSPYKQTELFVVARLSNNSKTELFVNKRNFDKKLCFLTVNKTQKTSIGPRINIENPKLELNKSSSGMVIADRNFDDFTSDSIKLLYLMEDNFLNFNDQYLQCPPKDDGIQKQPLILAPENYYVICPGATITLNFILDIDRNSYPDLRDSHKSLIERSKVSLLYGLQYSKQREGKSIFQWVYLDKIHSLTNTIVQLLDN